METTLFCSNCGKKIDSVNNFCVLCGAENKMKLSNTDNNISTPQVLTAQMNMEFLYIPISRLIWASILSFGFYRIFWFYMNWRAIEKASGKKVSAFWRGVFSFFWTHQPFECALKQAQELGYQEVYSTRLLSAFYFIAVLINYTLGKVSDLNPSFSVWWLVIGEFIVLLPLIKVQNFVNWSANKKHKTYRKLGWQEFGLIIFVWAVLFLWGILNK